MKDYNGFTPSQRNRAQAWLRKQWASGAVARPSECCACGQTHGIIDAHAEDYSEPFGPHIYQYPLCFVCHMMLHCRFKHPEAWAWYSVFIEEGGRVLPYFHRNINAIWRFIASIEDGVELPEGYGNLFTCRPREVKLFREISVTPQIPAT